MFQIVEKPQNHKTRKNIINNEKHLYAATRDIKYFYLFKLFYILFISFLICLRHTV